jgi:DNA-binding response OmpR family regulator
MSTDSGPILVIDDERDICELVQLTLEGLGFEVIVGYSGEEGLQLVESFGEVIQLIMLDLAMPGMSGVDVLGRVSKEVPNVPVVVMSGYVADRAEVAALGATDVLRKPFLLSDVEEKVKAILGL